MSHGPRVLVCDADPLSLRALRVVLRDAGYVTDVTATPEEALDRAALRPPDAAIVDAVAIVRRLREWSALPVIVLSAIEAEDATVRALDAGADDYVTKPFAPGELTARLRAVLRRAERDDDEAQWDLGGLEVNLAARVVRRGGEEVHLTPIEFRLLRVLLRHHGRLLTHNALLQEVWGPAYARDAQLLRVHIANLRRKIAPARGAGLIRTHRGVGYRLSAPHDRAA